MEIKHELLTFNSDNAYFTDNVNEELIAKYLKGVYRGNRPRFNQRFVEFFKAQFTAHNKEYYNCIIDNIIYWWDNVNPFTYKEAFEISDSAFRAKVFSSINITEMIGELGSTRIATEGRELINKVWNPIKDCFEEKPYTVIYELHHVNGSKLLEENSTNVTLPVVKCWCTSTNEEHWLWVDEKFVNNQSPLEAIVSTCVIYKSMYGKIKHIIRQGDVFLFEMHEDVTPSEKEDTMTLSVDEYFGLLKSQS